MRPRSSDPTRPDPTRPDPTRPDPSRPAFVELANQSPGDGPIRSWVRTDLTQGLHPRIGQHRRDRFNDVVIVGPVAAGQLLYCYFYALQ
jgi:hypothetical protein